MAEALEAATEAYGPPYDNQDSGPDRIISDYGVNDQKCGVGGKVVLHESEKSCLEASLGKAKLTVDF